MLKKDQKLDPHSRREDKKNKETNSKESREKEGRLEIQKEERKNRTFSTKPLLTERNGDRQTDRQRQRQRDRQRQRELHSKLAGMLSEGRRCDFWPQL